MNPSTALARVLVDELARCGLDEAVVAPGSRSTPLALALADHPAIRTHVRIDERSASFLALGLARTSRRATALVCTSGTAAANFHPAVLEADQSNVPLLLLTADRPPELRGTGANQTVDQIGLYGSAVRHFTEVGVPEAVPGMIAYWRSVACRAWASTTAEHPGPVHLNLAFRDPLVPDEDTHAVQWPESLDGRDDSTPWITLPHQSGNSAPLELPPVERGVIICGDGDYDPVEYLALAARTGWPLLAEPTSNARRADAISTYRHLLASPEFTARHTPELVVTVGRPGLSRQVLSYLRGAHRHIVVSTPASFADPVRTATDVVPAVSPPSDPVPDTGWSRSWHDAEATARLAIDTVLDREETFSELRLARDLAGHMPNGALLFAGSSMPIRDLDATMRPRCGARILGNRGVSGIDGSVSAAVGAALAHQSQGGEGAYALIGDLAALHDQNGLVIGPGESRPDLAVIVANNNGGGIFSGMEQAGHAGFERLFGTPHGVEMEHVAAMAGLAYSQVDHPSELPKALYGEGLRLIEVRTERSDAADLRSRIQDAVDQAVSE